MPALTITAVERDAKTGAVHLISGKTIYTWGSIEVLRDWLVANVKECDACLRAAVREILKDDADLSRTELFAPTTFTIAEQSVTMEAAGG